MAAQKTRRPQRARSTKTEKLHPQPVRFDEEEGALIKQLQDATNPRLSVSEITKRAVRFAVPKFLTGEAPVVPVNPRQG